MAINKPSSYYEIGITQRPPTLGDVAQHYDLLTDTYRYAIFDGTRWQEMNDMGTTVAKTLTSTSTTGITATQALANQAYVDVSTAAGVIKHDVVTMIEKNIRVAEIYDTNTLKLKRTELQFREGPGSQWEPIQRVKLYE